MVADPLADLQAMVNQALGSTDRYVLNSEAVVDEGPQFLAYFVFDTQGTSGNQVAAAVLQNGTPQSPVQTLPSERMPIPPAEGGPMEPGMQPGGAGAFAGYSWPMTPASTRQPRSSCTAMPARQSPATSCITRSPA